MKGNVFGLIYLNVTNKQISVFFLSLLRKF